MVEFVVCLLDVDIGENKGDYNYFNINWNIVCDAGVWIQWGVQLVGCEGDQ